MRSEGHALRFEFTTNFTVVLLKVRCHIFVVGSACPEVNASELNQGYGYLFFLRAKFCLNGLTHFQVNNKVRSAHMPLTLFTKIHVYADDSKIPLVYISGSRYSQVAYVILKRSQLDS